MPGNDADEVARLFDEAAALPPAQRAAFLDEACRGDAALRQEIESLLMADDVDDPFLETPAVIAGADLLSDAGSDEPTPVTPRTIANYRITRILGEGGMSIVYLAEQDQPRRAVAIKVIKQIASTPSMLQRFAHESEILGRLHHPGIAQVYEVGTADLGSGAEQPFFAMELIRGPTLTDYARARNLDTNQRLGLFVQVCEAVQHAHLNGVIHRDLKPANILVDEGSGRPKVLDFGVARITDSDIRTTTLQTNVGELIGTIPYMSPEQVSGDPTKIDTRSDVYALGLLVYELLCDRLPYDVSNRSIPDAIRVILETDQTRLGTIDRTYRGDLDTITAKALEKDPERRYASVAALAADVERYLANQPILARPVTTLYQLRKFARRNRALVAGIAAVFVTLFVGIVVASSFAVSANRARQKLAAEAETTGRALDFLVGLFEISDPDESGGREVSARELLDAGAARIEQELEGSPEVRATLLVAMGNAYFGLGHYPEAAELLEGAVRDRRATLGDDHVQTARALRDLGWAELRAGRTTDAEQRFREALEIHRNREPGARGYPGAEEADLAKTTAGAEAELELATAFDDLAMALTVLEGHDEEAEALLREALAIKRRRAAEQTAGVAGDEPGEPPGMTRDVAITLNNLGTALQNQGKYDGAEEAFREAIAIRRRLDGVASDRSRSTGTGTGTGTNDTPARVAGDERSEPPGRGSTGLARALDNLGYVLFFKGEYDEAETVSLEALAIRRRLLGDRHPDIGWSYSTLAALRYDAGDMPGAERYFRQALAIFRALDNKPAIAQMSSSLGAILYEQGRFDEAEPLSREAVALDRELYGDEDSNLAWDLHNLGELLHEKGDYAAAEAQYEEALVMRRKLLPEGHTDLAESLARIGMLHLDRALAAEAEAPLREALTIRRAATPDNWRTAHAAALLGESLAEQSGGRSGAGGGEGAADTDHARRAEAETLLLEAYEKIAATRGPDSPQAKRTLEAIIRLYENWNRPDDAAQWRTKAG